MTDMKAAKKRGGASTDMVPSKGGKSPQKPLTDIRNYEQRVQ